MEYLLNVKGIEKVINQKNHMGNKRVTDNFLLPR